MGYKITKAMRRERSKAEHKPEGRCREAMTRFASSLVRASNGHVTGSMAKPKGFKKRWANT